MPLLYPEPARAVITDLDINGQGSRARLDPGAPLVITGKYKVQNPKTDPTDTVQIIVFREDEFLKCVFNDVPREAPNYTEGSFKFRCTAPTTPGTYRIRMGWGYNWNWPEQAYKYLLGYPEDVVDVGVLYVGPAPGAELAPYVPAILVIVPIGILMGMMALTKRRR